MTLEDIVALVDAHESGTREFKSTTGERRKAAQSLCAMLNHRGGHVLFGVAPKGEIVGQHVQVR